MIGKFIGKKGLFAVVLAYIMIFNTLFSFNVSAAKPDRNPPSAPTNLRAASVTTASISLVWDASTDNVGVKSYDIYRNSVKIGNA